MHYAPLMKKGGNVRKTGKEEDLLAGDVTDEGTTWRTECADSPLEKRGTSLQRKKDCKEKFGAEEEPKTGRKGETIVRSIW